jgi:cytochrome c553
MNSKRLTATFLACCLSTLATADIQVQEPAEPVLDQDRLGAGFRALEAACFGCHSADASLQDRVAPPMYAIKKHYVDGRTTYTEFREQLGHFVNNPSSANARMPGAIERFGLMPMLGVGETMLDEVAYYVFHTPLERPGWFAEHYRSEQRRYQRTAPPTLRTEADYLSHGQSVAMRTKAELGSKLKRALTSGGPVTAVQFCKEEAAPIAATMSTQLKARIQRVSDRPRNPDNAASAMELDYIASAKAALAAGGKPAPALQETDSHKVAYYPIMTNGMCLQCHGEPGRDITDETLSVLRKAYPADMATGYSANELRGIWVITMENDNESSH